MPKLSIILPTLRYDNARQCINAIAVNTVVDYEIIVVTTNEIKYQLSNSFNDMIPGSFCIDSKCIGTTYAIGLGLTKATGDYIVTLSDDCRVCPHWDSHMLAFLEAQPKNHIVLGNFKVYDHTGVMPNIGYYGHPFSMFPIISRKNLNKLGEYYSLEYNAFYSDPDLGMRVYEDGFVKTCPTAFIYHVFNADSLHNANKDKYFKKDEETFIKKWGHLGEFKGCEIIKE